MTVLKLTEEVLAEKASSLPSLPIIVSELLATFDQADLDVPTLARSIANDQSLAARALRIANSSFYGLPGRVANIQDAIVILGFRAVRSLVLSAAMVNSLANVGGSPKDSRGFWRHSVGTALCARGLAHLVGQSPETAFTAGLLHDIGRVFLAACFPDHYLAVRKCKQEKDLTFIEAEHETMGLDHGIAGGILARQWGFPLQITDAIARHHYPDSGQPAMLTDVCHGADLLARAVALDYRPDGCVAPVSAPAWERLAPDWNAMGALLKQVEADMEETCLALVPA